jgi:queuine tRNA-ribosyltransferase
MMLAVRRHSPFIIKCRCMQTMPIYDGFDFVVQKTSEFSKARLAKISTPHGDISTPAFVFCATKAAMKAATPQTLRESGTEFILSNTYHLMLSPGPDIIEKMGGLQKFTGWNGPMLTDSGGYQIFSMGHGSVSDEIKGKRQSTPTGWNQTLLSITEKGAKFRSYVDGTTCNLTPELSIEIQRKLGE